MKWLKQIKQYFCNHEYKMSKFQALTGRLQYECKKCGKQYKD